MAKKQSSYPLPHRQRPTSVRFKATESGRPPHMPKRRQLSQVIAAFFVVSVVISALVAIRFLRSIEIDPKLHMVANSPCDNRVLLRGAYFPANTPVEVFYTLLNTPYPVKPDSASFIHEASVLTDSKGNFTLTVEPFSKPGMADFAGIEFAAQIATNKTMAIAPLSLIKVHQPAPSLETFKLPGVDRVDLAPLLDVATGAAITNTGHWSATYYIDTDMLMPLSGQQEPLDIWFPNGLSGSLGEIQLSPSNHSALFERNETFPQPVNLKLMLTVDDGAQVYVDDKLVIDEKRPGSLRTSSAAIALQAGLHRFRVNYFQSGGAAMLCFSWRETYDNWITRYYSNPNLDGSPQIVRDENSIALDWPTTPPLDMNLPEKSYSASWDRDVTLKGEYELKLETTGTARVYIDGFLIPTLNHWDAINPAPTTQVCQLSNGPHHITVQYRNTGGPARIKFDYQLRDETKLPMTHAPVTCS